MAKNEDRKLIGRRVGDFFDQIDGIPCRDAIVKDMTNIIAGIVDDIHRRNQVRAINRMGRFVGENRKKGSIKLASVLYHDVACNDWVEKRRERYEGNQLAFVGMVAPRYVAIMNALTYREAKIVLHVLSFYRRGVESSVLAKRCFMHRNVVSSFLTRLRGAGLIEVNSHHRWYVTDKDWLRVHAIRWDWRWPAWFRKNRNENEEDVIDQFICSIGKKN